MNFTSRWGMETGLRLGLKNVGRRLLRLRRQTISVVHRPGAAVRDWRSERARRALAALPDHLPGAAFDIVNPPAGATLRGDVKIEVAYSGFDRGPVEFAVDGVVRAVRERPPFGYTWRTGAEANTAHAVTAAAVDRRATARFMARITVTVANKGPISQPLALGAESAYYELNKGKLAAAENLLEDVWPARGFPLPRLDWPLTWHDDPYEDAYWRFHFYSLRPTVNLLWAWHTTEDRRFLERLIAILRSYVSHDRKRERAPRTFDNKHAAAFRAMVLANTYAKLRAAGELPVDLDGELLAAIERLGRFLEDPGHFEDSINHGFNEAMALLLVATTFPRLPKAPGWRTTAVARLLRMVAENVDSDGVEVENSPFYHFYVLGIVSQIARWAAAREPQLAAVYEPVQRSMLRYAAYVTQPDGYLPMLGATATTLVPAEDRMLFEPMTALNPEFAFVFSRGARGKAPEALALFPESGLFILRSPLPASYRLKDQTFMTFDAGSYRTNHSDLDALSVTFYANGVALLPDSGLFTYNMEPERSYFHGTRAHNTVVVDDRDQAAGNAVPGAHGEIQGSAWASGTSMLYDGVTHRRTVVLLRPGIALVLDALRGGRPHRYVQIWHVAPDLELDRRGLDVVIVDAGGRPVLGIRQAHPEGLALSSCSGQMRPVQGWYSRRHGEKQPNLALQYLRQGRHAEFATVLLAGDAAARPATVDLRTDRTTSTATIEVGSARYVVTTANAGREDGQVDVLAIGEEPQMGQAPRSLADG